MDKINRVLSIEDATILEAWPTITAGIGSFGCLLFGYNTASIKILMAFMTIDIITGVAKGIYNKKLRSAKAHQGMIKKGMVVLVIILANLLDVLSGNDMPIFRTIGTYYYIGFEGMSIIENLGLMGVPLPKAITGRFEQLTTDNDKEV